MSSQLAAVGPDKLIQRMLRSELLNIPSISFARPIIPALTIKSLGVSFADKNQRPPLKQ
jgi:hypothetical protein